MHTLIVVGTKRKTALAGVILIVSFPRFVASITTFNDEREHNPDSSVAGILLPWSKFKLVTKKRGGE